MKYSKLILFTLISVILTDLYRKLGSVGVLNLNSIAIFATILNYSSIAILIYYANKVGFGGNDTPRAIRYLFIIWILGNILSLIRGSFFAEDYWDWKAILLYSLAFSFIPMTFFIGRNIESAQSVFRFVIKVLFPYGFVLIPLAFVSSIELYSRIMIPVGLFIVFLPFLKYRWKLLVIIVAATSILIVIEFRSNIIKIAFSVGLIFIYYLRNFVPRITLRLLRIFLFALPIVLLALAVSGEFNIFSDIRDQEGYTTVNSSGEAQNMMADTRSGLYRDVLATMDQSGNWLMGEGAGGRYQTERFDYLGDGRGRYGSEVGILNILLYHGLIGVSIYFLLLFTVSYYAIRRSNNTLAQLLGLYIAFRWTYAFVEEFTTYDLNFYFFWIIVGLVSSTRFREMTNDDIKQYLELR